MLVLSNIVRTKSTSIMVNGSRLTVYVDNIYLYEIFMMNLCSVQISLSMIDVDKAILDVTLSEVSIVNSLQYANFLESLSFQ